MNKLLSLCFLALSILTATSDNPAFSFFSSPANLSSPSSAYTEPVQEYNAGVFTLSIPSSFEKITDQITTLLDSDGKPLAFRPAEFVRDASNSKDEITIYISFFDQDGDMPFNTLEENYNVINQTLLTASSETPSYKYINSYLFGFTSEENNYFCSADFAIGTGIDTLLVEVICNELDDAISIRDHLMDTLKIDSSSPSFTDPVQEFTAGVFTLNIPSSFEKKRDQDPLILDLYINNEDNSLVFFKPTAFGGTIYDSKKTASIMITVFKNETANSSNTLEENYKAINKALQTYPIESPSYKYIDGYLVGLTSQEFRNSCFANFAIEAGTDVLLVHIISDRLDDSVSLRDRLLDTLKIAPPQQ